jgi:hypothetical protein
MGGHAVSPVWVDGSRKNKCANDSTMILNLVIGIYHSLTHEIPREATPQWLNFIFNQKNTEKNQLKQ